MSLTSKIWQRLQSIKNWSRGDKLALTGAVIALVVGLPAWIVIINPSKPEILPYDNTFYQLSIKYPKDWNLEEKNNAIISEVVEIISPKEWIGDNFQQRVIVLVHKEVNMSLDEYTKSQIKSIYERMTNAKIQKQEEFTLANNRGYQVVYEANYENKRVKRMEVWTLKGFKAYHIIYEAQPNTYDKFLPQVTEMTKSLQIKEQQSTR